MAVVKADNPVQADTTINHSSSGSNGKRQIDPMIGAGIDIGTNTFRLLVVQVREGNLVPLARELIPVRLGEGLGRGNKLAKAACTRAEAALVRFKDILTRYSPDSLRICATQALRTAADGDKWIGRVKTTLGYDIEVISAREEALLGLTGALAGYEHHPPSPLLLVDVGGGSSEIVLAVNANEPFSSDNQVVSMELGAVGLTERFLQQPVADANDVAAMSQHIEQVLSDSFNRFDRPLAGGKYAVLAIGGTATALAALDLGLEAYDGQLVQGRRLDVMTLERIWNRLSRLSAVERNRLPGLDQRRGEIILGGLRIYQLLLRQLGVRSMVVSDTGLLEGIALSGAPGPEKGRQS